MGVFSFWGEVCMRACVCLSLSVRVCVCLRAYACVYTVTMIATRFSTYYLNSMSKKEKMRNERRSESMNRRAAMMRISRGIKPTREQNSITDGLKQLIIIIHTI